MPLVIRVGVSRKASEDFQSKGWTLDIQSEFDARTFDNTEALADATNHLFQLANDLLDEQVLQSRQEAQAPNGQQLPSYNGSSNPGSRPTHRSGGSNGRQQTNGTYSRNANGSSQGHRTVAGPKNGNGRPERPITAAQKTAIEKMAQRFDTNGEAVAQEDFGTSLAQLTIRQASELIDRMKKSLEAQEGQGAGR